MAHPNSLTYTCTLHKYQFAELTLAQQQLCNKAIEASKTAFAPFSKFKVGAAALLENGHFVLGSNQENVAYPSGLCAERVALFACGAQHNGLKISALAVYVDSFENMDEIPMPCGGCRQVMNQSEVNQGQEMPILLVTMNKEVFLAKNTETLLPFPFKF